MHISHAHTDSSGHISDHVALPFLLPCTTFVGSHLTELEQIMLECLWISLFLLVFYGASLFTETFQLPEVSSHLDPVLKLLDFFHHISLYTYSTLNGIRTTQDPESWFCACSVDVKHSYFSKWKGLNSQRKWWRLQFICSLAQNEGRWHHTDQVRLNWRDVFLFFWLYCLSSRGSKWLLQLELFSCYFPNYSSIYII